MENGVAQISFLGWAAKRLRRVRAMDKAKQEKKAYDEIQAMITPFGMLPIVHSRSHRSQFRTVGTE